MFDSQIRYHAGVTPHAAAIIATQGYISYARFNADIDRFGAAIHAMGFRPATGVVSICVADGYLSCVLITALARLGIATSPFDDPGADVRLVDVVVQADPDGDGPADVALPPTWVAQVSLSEPRPLPTIEPEPDAVGRVMLSSGTTRAPRRIALTWRVIQAINLAGLSSRGAGVHGVWIPLTTLETIQGFGMAVSAWSQGSALACGVGIAESPGIIGAYPAGLLGCTPAQLRTILRTLPEEFAPRPGWRINLGGANLPPGLAREARLRITPDVRVAYGATEAMLCTCGPSTDLDQAPGCVGYPVGGVLLKVVDESGRTIHDGRSGEIQVRGDRVVAGYLNDPEATADRFREGWFLTGDIGRRLADGRIILEGRLDDRMNLEGGWKFMPAVLEEAARSCPGVVECAAFAAPHEDGFDQCWLAVVLATGSERQTLTRHLSGLPGLPPVHIGWIDAIPHNAAGKVARERLRELVLATRAQAGVGKSGA
jgi:acyl-CoA synthetase (AMP-forming)/AMP-acid ligase II